MLFLKKGNVRFILKKNEPLEKIKAFSYYPDLETESVPPRLEDSFMLALREAEEKENSLAGFEVDYKKHVLISEDVDIKVKNLVRRFGDFVAVDNTSFQVHKGKYSGFWNRTAREIDDV